MLSAAAAVGRTALSFLAVFCLVAAAVRAALHVAEEGQATLYN
jgi:hypothetical protein